jgi:hypothetical protein
MRLLGSTIIWALLILGSRAPAQTAPAFPDVGTSKGDVISPSNCNNPELKYFCKAIKGPDPDFSGTLGSRNGTGGSMNLQKQLDPF